uniref:TOX high mobility group box family member 4 n=2 Tax=Anopheles arabiensis TaxID=7173 RepID=A0A182IES0_ANOAR
MGTPQQQQQQQFQHQHIKQEQQPAAAMVQQQSCPTSTAEPPAAIPQTCIRQGCNNLAIENPDWEDEYCSQECVVAHCRAVFATFQEDCLKGNAPPQPPQQQSYPAVK